MERVQLNLERLLPELRDLERKKIFSKVMYWKHPSFLEVRADFVGILQSEISEIVKRRTAFENCLIRKGSTERDWLDYIEYEKRLEKLRKIRYNKLSKYIWSSLLMSPVEKLCRAEGPAYCVGLLNQPTYPLPLLIQRNPNTRQHSSLAVIRRARPSNI